VTLPGPTLAPTTQATQSVLHLEDSDEFAALVGELLGDAGFTVRRARTLQEAEQAAEEESFACAFIDLALPDAGGLEAIMGLRSASPGLPLVVLSGQDTSAAAVKAMLLGAQDWVGKHEVTPERLSRAAQLAIARQDAQAQLAWRASHDELTGLPNRPVAMDQLARAISRASRKPACVGVLFGDLDNFKSFNDRAGHAAGDRVLAAVAHRLVVAVRPGDTVARWSGDEFVVVAGELGNADEGVALATRIRAAVAQPFDAAETSEPITITIGVAIAGGAGTAHDALEAADQAMLKGKRTGAGILLAAG
jgi:diguanylate cyclase (GGDEF)-like protein